MAEVVGRGLDCHFVPISEIAIISAARNYVAAFIMPAVGYSADPRRINP